MTQPLLHFYTFHRWDLIKNFVKSGPSKAVSLHEAIQGLFSDHFLISSSLIVAMTVLLNGDATETMKALESAAHINVENVHTFAEILLRAISNLEHTK